MADDRLEDAEREARLAVEKRGTRVQPLVALAIILASREKLEEALGVTEQAEAAYKMAIADQKLKDAIGCRRGERGAGLLEPLQDPGRRGLQLGVVLRGSLKESFDRRRPRVEARGERFEHVGVLAVVGGEFRDQVHVLFPACWRWSPADRSPADR